MSIESQLEVAPEEIKLSLFRELLAIELESRVSRGERPIIEEYESRFPNLQHEIQRSFAEMCDEPVRKEIPQTIGRYSIQKCLGSGSFGDVYLAFDEQLQRSVAIKVPHRKMISQREDVKSYLDEAQAVASLDHPHIVPIYDVGRSEEFPCYTVSKYVMGSDLAQCLRQDRFSWQAAAELIASIADALHHAHTRGLVHRDVKPGNILLDDNRTAYLVDFGLALKERDLASGAKYAGTPSYMSPEQARGEGHRVDGRSDIYSLGTVLYEMLTGRRTFVDSSPSALLSLIATHDPKPPRQIDDSVPKELERICLKAVSRRTPDRYTTALDMAEELRLFLGLSEVVLPTPHTTAIQPATSSVLPAAGSDSQPMQIVPKGLRSFGRKDSAFFLKLLPGPRDQSGLPDSIRFWKDLIEDFEPDNTFQVGLIYGPSGCGKSSLMKAGLLPQLSDKITPVYVEATSEATETRLLGTLRTTCPRLPLDIGLKETIVAIRHGKHLAPGTKVLIVLDQFEQWLHDRNHEDNELVQTLRQCDGRHVQCILMVRDEFWLTVSRLMRDLELDLVPGRNIMLTDLFDIEHACRVLRAFGRAFDRFPKRSRDATPEQISFVTEAVDSLAENGTVTCVRLSLFAEMMKAKMWTPASLLEGGGPDGLGVTFLDEAFSARTANPRHREHKTSARAVLKRLLPDSGTDIKGQMQSYDELRVASGYSADSHRFDELIRILDRDLRLITPTDAESEATDEEATDTANRFKHYQLTHDFLVPSVRTWLTRQQQATRKGRAELRLARRTELWSTRPENRLLPSALEWFRIRALTSQATWTKPQREMMQKAARTHGMTWSIGTIVLLVLGIAIQQLIASSQLANLTARVETAVQTMANGQGRVVPLAIENLEMFPRDMVIAELRGRFADSDDVQKLALVYALAHFESSETEFMVSRIHDASDAEVDNLVKALAYSREESTAILRKAAEACDAKLDWRLKQRLSIVALHLGDSSIVQSMCEPRPDPIQRTSFVEYLGNWHGDHALLANVAATIDDPAVRSALCMGMGCVPDHQVNSQIKQLWQPIFSDWFQNDLDSGVHSAASWILRAWALKTPEIATSPGPLSGRKWHCNGMGMTMLEIPPGNFERVYGVDHNVRNSVNMTDSPPKQNVTITRPYLLCDREVTIEQFLRFLADKDYPEKQKPVGWEPDPTFSPTAKHPVQMANWNDAVLFCNWLSNTEGLSPGYVLDGTWEFQQLAKWELVPDSNGYRLPTEAEWEYACRSGTTTLFSSGDVDRWLTRYAVMASSRTEIPGSRLPTAWGLFDMHGNVAEWIHDWYHSLYPDSPALVDPMGPSVNNGYLRRPLRGGHFQSTGERLFSSFRDSTVFSSRSNYIGFRVARSLPH